MAILDPGPFVDGVSGRLGSHQFTKHPYIKGGKFAIKETKPHKPADRPDDDPRNCPCKAFKSCDAQWVAMTEAQKAVWIGAVKKPGMSGYDLWMKECLTCYNDGLPSPGEPSASGGYSTSFVNCSGGVNPPVIGKAPPPPPPPPYGNPCEYCVGDPPKYFTVHFPLMDPECTWSGKHVTVTQTESACTWYFGVVGTNVVLHRPNHNHWVVTSVDTEADCFCNTLWGNFAAPDSCWETLYLPWQYCECDFPWECHEYPYVFIWPLYEEPA